MGVGVGVVEEEHLQTVGAAEEGAGAADGMLRWMAAAAAAAEVVVVVEVQHHRAEEGDQEEAGAGAALQQDAKEVREVVADRFCSLDSEAAEEGEELVYAKVAVGDVVPQTVQEVPGHLEHCAVVPWKEAQEEAKAASLLAERV